MIYNNIKAFIAIVHQDDNSSIVKGIHVFHQMNQYNLELGNLTWLNSCMQSMKSSIVLGMLTHLSNKKCIQLEGIDEKSYKG